MKIKTEKTRQRSIAIILAIVFIASAIVAINFAIPNKTASAVENNEFMDTPQITVLTHGLGGGASHWSTENGTGSGGFAEDIDSLVYKLSNRAGGAYLYRAATDTATDANGEKHETYSTSYTLYENYSTNPAATNKCDCITDVSKHIIIVFDSKSSGESNEVVYHEFENMLNDVIARVKSLNPGNEKPRINLIGHSRGGLTNLEYALDHPEYVDSLISIGTPYFSAPAAEIAVGIDFIKAKLTFNLNGINSIIDADTYNGYYNRWTSGYESKYKYINSIAIGGMTTLDYQSAVIENNASSANLDDVASLINFLNADLLVALADMFPSAAYSLMKENLPWIANLTEDQVSDIIAFLNDETSGGTWYGDVLVPIASQQGISGDKNYYFTKYVKMFDLENDTLKPGLASDMLAIVHSIEPYDPDIHNYILDNIIMKSGDTIATEISNVGCSIAGIGAGITPIVLDWQIKIRNVHDEPLTYIYNYKMCFFDDAKEWDGLKHIKTVRLDPGETAIVDILSNGTATSIAVSYVTGRTRHIIYADSLFAFKSVYKMQVYTNTKTYNSYNRNGMIVSIVGKNGNTWLIDLTNDTGDDRTFAYNSRMCDKGDAENWTGLNDVKYIWLEDGFSTEEPLEITENAAATSIAISYTEGIQRYIFYANQLDKSGTMEAQGNVKPQIYDAWHNIGVAIVGKEGNIWTVYVANNTGEDRTFYYNRKMCYAGDAEHWTNLSHESSVFIPDGQSREIEISENASATSIAISYKDELDRYIVYGYDLDKDSLTMTCLGSTVKPPYYNRNGITAAIAGKSGSTWSIYLRNDTGETQTFEYNTRMCYAGDAKKWKNLSDPGYVTLAPNGWATISISENLTATSIAISYMDGVYRKIFYAYHLDEDTATMEAFGSEVDTSAPSDGGCLAPGTMITLADGTQKAVEELTGEEMLLVWDMETGTYSSAPILFIDSELTGHYDVIEASFSDGTAVDIISEHGFWDADLNEYVYLDENAADYIGHKFIKQDGDGYTEVTLTDVEITTEITEAYSPVTYGHLCYYVNGMLSMPGGVTGLMNIFEVDPDTLTIDAEAYAADIAEYGLFTYEEFCELYPVPEEIFDAFNGEYLKVSVGKGLITYDQLGALIERYAEFF